MQNAAFRALGIDAMYEAVQVSRKSLSEMAPRLRTEYSGFNVTTPLKEDVMDILDASTDLASAVGAANTVRVEKGRMTGHNTDGLGFAAAIGELWHIVPRGKAVCILGSGPAARAIAQTLGGLGVGSLRCWSRNPLTAAEIGPPPDTRPDLLVSALPAQAEVPPDVLAMVEGATYVFDVNYGAPRSPIRESIGAHRSDGLPLLLHQGAISFAWWTGTTAPLEAMRAAVMPEEV